MIVPALIARLKRCGVTFGLSADGRLKVEPKSKLTADEIALLRQHRDAVCAHLSGETAVVAPGDRSEKPPVAPTPAATTSNRAALQVREPMAVPPMAAPATRQPADLDGVAAALRGLSRPSGSWRGGDPDAEAMQALWDAAHGQ